MTVRRQERVTDRGRERETDRQTERARERDRQTERARQTCKMTLFIFYGQIAAGKAQRNKIPIFFYGTHQT